MGFGEGFRIRNRFDTGVDAGNKRAGQLHAVSIGWWLGLVVLMFCLLVYWPGDAMCLLTVTFFGY